MCQFGGESKILRELNLSENEAKIGIRGWYISNSFSKGKKELKSLHIDYIWPLIAEGNLEKENLEGIYSYNNNYYYNYYNNYNNYYKNNYYKNNNYNNYYNNYNYYYNYYSYNNYSYNNYYYITGTILLYGKVFEYKEGYRSQFAKVKDIAIIDNPKWLNSEIEKDQNFIEHFHSVCKEVAENYKIKLIGYSELEKIV